MNDDDDADDDDDDADDDGGDGVDGRMRAKVLVSRAPWAPSASRGAVSLAASDRVDITQPLAVIRAWRVHCGGFPLRPHQLAFRTCSSWDCPPG